MNDFNKKNMDVLQNLEFGIIEVYRADPSLLDVDAKDAIEALLRHYHALEVQKTPPARSLPKRVERVFQSVQQKCEWRLGNAVFAGESEKIGIPLPELVVCPRTIQKSIPR